MASEPTSTDDLRPWDGPAVLHMDLDAFFAAVEQLDHPEWRGKPVIVGGSPTKRGVVSTASYEARRFGVHSAMPSVRAAALCPDAIWATPTFGRYREMSEAVFAILRDETPSVQPVSIDEAYLDVTPGRFAHEHPILTANRIRKRVAALGLTCSVGVATAKAVAKIASDCNKPDGLTVVWPGEETAFLAPLPVRDMPGIGPKTAERLGKLGVRTLGDVAAFDEVTALEVLGRHGMEIVMRARGVDPRAVRENDPVKSVSNERTFAADVRTLEDVTTALDGLAAKVASRLRRKGIAGRTVTVKLRYSDFTTRTAQRTLTRPTDDDAEFGEIARELLRESWTPGVGLRLLGVGVSGFTESAEQLDLLASAEPPEGPPVADATRDKRRRLVAGMDAIREKYGDSALRYGREVARSRPDTGSDAGLDEDDG